MTRFCASCIWSSETGPNIFLYRLRVDKAASFAPVAASAKGGGANDPAVAVVCWSNLSPGDAALEDDLDAGDALELVPTNASFKSSDAAALGTKTVSRNAVSADGATRCDCPGEVKGRSDGSVCDAGDDVVGRFLSGSAMSALSHLPEYFDKYFVDSALQNKIRSPPCTRIVLRQRSR
jgi:hypothetical protein